MIVYVVIYYPVFSLPLLFIIYFGIYLTLTTWFILSTRWVVLTILVCMLDPDYDVTKEVAIDPQDQDYFNELYQKFD